MCIAPNDLGESVPFGFDELALHPSGERHPHRAPLLVGKVFLDVLAVRYTYAFFSPLGVTLTVDYPTALRGIVRLDYRAHVIIRNVGDVCVIKKSKIYCTMNCLVYGILCQWLAA